MSYKDILKNHRKKHHKKYYKPNLTTLGNKNDGLECDKFDDVINLANEVINLADEVINLANEVMNLANESNLFFLIEKLKI